MSAQYLWSRFDIIKSITKLSSGIYERSMVVGLKGPTTRLGPTGLNLNCELNWLVAPLLEFSSNIEDSRSFL